MRNREYRLFIRVTAEERHRICEKMYGMGIHSLSAYIRKNGAGWVLSEP